MAATVVIVNLWLQLVACEGGINRCNRMQSRCGEVWNGEILSRHEQFDLGTPRDGALGSLLDHTFDDVKVPAATLVSDNPAYELAVDNRVDGVPVLLVRDEHGEVASAF